MIFRTVFGQCKECKRLIAAARFDEKDVFSDIQEFMRQDLDVSVKDTIEPVTIQDHQESCSEYIKREPVTTYQFIQNFYIDGTGKPVFVGMPNMKVIVR